MRARRNLLRAAGLMSIATITRVAGAQVASPHAIDIPRWVTKTFLNYREDVRDAASENKHLMVYFGQDGCPYCKQLLRSRQLRRQNQA